MKRSLSFTPLILSALLAGCGGGGSSDLSQNTDTGGGATEKRFQQASPPQEASNVVELGDHTLAQGSVTPVTFRLRNPYHLSQISLRVLYDGSKFEPVNPALLPGAPSELKGSMFGEYNVLLRVDYECGAAASARRGIFVSMSSQVVNGRAKDVNESGPLVTLYFRPRAGVPAGAESPITADYDQSAFFNLNAGQNGNPYNGQGFIAAGRLAVGPPSGGGLTFPEGRNACDDTPTVPPASSDQNVLVVGEHTVSKSQPSPVEIRVENPSHLLGFQTALEYDSRLFQIVDIDGTDLEETVTQGSVLRGASFTINYFYNDYNNPLDPSSGKGRTVFLMSGVTEASRGGKLITLYFRARPDAPVGASAPLNWYPGYSTVFAVSFGQSPVGSVRSGTLTVGP